MHQYIIGIDLGTTNCTMAYAKKDQSEICQFFIPQNFTGQTEQESPSLPSFLYFPLEEEKTLCKEASYIVGAYAKERGAQIPDRLIHSAKSWICHDGINRRENFLPLLNEESTNKLSPIDVLAAFLKKLKNSWDAHFSEAPFEKQNILVTVPASFDPSARQFVLEASLLAGFPQVTLLEEPLSAFYAWLHAKEKTWRKVLSVGDTVLVVDIGGGTTDFTLISVDEENGNLCLKRQSVGEHLLLGGDNIDCAIAYLAKEKLETGGHAIDDWQLQCLVHSSRQAKEVLLSDDTVSQIELTILGRGSKLIGGSLQTLITKQEIAALIESGFAPLVSFDEKVQKPIKSGLSHLSLPFVSDPRITSQLAAFLSLSLEGREKGKFPTAVIFNGGTMKSNHLRNRIIQQLNEWAKDFHQTSIRELEGSDYDFAVSRGAVAYALAKEGKGIRVKGGINRSFFVGIESSAPAIPGRAPSVKALCVAPFGMEEGSKVEIANQKFSLVLGEMAAFRFFSRSSAVLSNGQAAQVGLMLSNWQKELTELHPIQTLIDKSEKDGKTILIHLISQVTELGVLELWCHSEDGRSWKLEYDTRS